MKPLSKYVMIKPEEVAKVSKGGITLLPSAQDKKNKGTVVGIGPEVSKSILKIGDTILYKEYAACTEIDDFLFLKDEDILAVLE